MENKTKLKEKLIEYLKSDKIEILGFNLDAEIEEIDSIYDKNDHSFKKYSRGKHCILTIKIKNIV